MAPTRMKLRVRRRDTAAGGEGSTQPEEQRRECGTRTSSRRKKPNSNAATSSTSTPPSTSTSTSSSSTRAAMVVAAEDTSPDSKCPICLDRFNNLAYLDRCLHRFCFPCIQEWSHNKAECPLCKQPFASILHSVRAQDDFKEYTLQPAPAASGGNSSTAAAAATAAVVAAVAAAAARSEHQMRLMLRRRRRTTADTGRDTNTRSYLHGETPVRRWRRERSGRAGGAGGAGGSSSSEYGAAWEWHFDAPPPPAPFAPLHYPPHPPPALLSEVGQDRGGEDDPERQRTAMAANAEGHGTGLSSPPKNPVSFERVSQRLIRCLSARQQSQRAGTLQTLSERETLRLRRALYYCGVRVHGVAGISGPEDAPREITADSFHRHRANMNRLVPWLRRELTVLYGTQRHLVDLVLGIIAVQVSRHGLENLAALEAELRPFLLIRTNHFVHELLSFARSPLTMELYDTMATYEPPTSAGAPVAASETDSLSSPSGGSSVIAISEDEVECGGGRSAVDDVIQTGSLNLSLWDDETPGPSYSTAETLSSLATPQQESTNQDTAQQQGEEDEEEECLIVGYKKPIAERTPELVQLSSDTEEENADDKAKEEESTEKGPPLPSVTTTTTTTTADPPSSLLPTIPPSTSGTYKEGQAAEDADGSHPRSRSWSASSGKSRDSVCVLSPSKDKGRRHRRSRSRSRQKRSGTLTNPNRSIYPPMMGHRRRHSPSSVHSSMDSGSPLSPSSPLDLSWSFACSPLSSTLSSRSSSSSSSSPCPSPCPSPSLSTQRSSPQTPPTPQLQDSPCDGRHREKPGGKRKYKSRHLDNNNDKDPTWRPSGEERREKKRESDEKRRRRRRREDRERKRRRRESDRHRGQSNSRKSREERSPSVEIIFERTAPSCDVTLLPAHKHRRRRPQTTTRTSPPVVITLDSDSSCDHVNVKNFSSSSSPLSSQQTVDFSDLPPLPLVHSSGMGGTLGEEIGDLPVDILDRNSDVSEVEVWDRSKATAPIAVESIDNSDREVDVENDNDEGSSLSPGKPIRTHNPKPASTSDTRLLTTVLDDVKDVVQPHCSFDSTKERFQHEGRSASQSREDSPQDLEVVDVKDENPLPPQKDLENTKTSPQLSLSDRLPLCPSDVAAKLSVDQGPNPSSSQIDSRHVIPPISTLKKPFVASLELRGLPMSIPGFQSSRLLASSESQSSPHIEGLTSDLCKPPAETHLSSTPEEMLPGADCSPHPRLTNSSILQSSSEVTSSPCESAVPALCRSLSTDPGRSEEGPHHSASSIARSERSNVEADAGAGEATAPAAGSSSFSGVTSENTSPAVSVSSSDSPTLNSFSTVGSHSSQKSPSSFDLSSSNKNDPPSKRFHESTGNPTWTFNSHHLSAPDDGRTSSVANRDGSLQPVDLNSTSSLAHDRLADSSDAALTDGRLNHTALPSSKVHINNTKRSTPSEQIVDSKHPNHLGSRYDPLVSLKNCQLSIDSKTSRRDIHRDDCLAPSPATSEPIPGDVRLDSRSPVEEPSQTSIWTNSAT